MLLAWQVPSLSDSLVYASTMNFHTVFDRTIVSSQNENERMKTVVKEQTQL